MNQNPTLNFELTLEEANMILAGLQELPGKICNPLSDKIKQQAAPQLQELEKQAKAEETPPAE